MEHSYTSDEFLDLLYICKAFIWPLFLKGILLFIEFCIDFFFSSSTLNVFSTFPLGFFPVRNLFHSYLYSQCVICLYFLAAFTIFPFVLASSTLIMMNLGGIFFTFLVLSICRTSRISRFIVCIKFENWGHYFFEYFSVPSHLSSPSEIPNYMCVRLLEVILKLTDALWTSLDSSFSLWLILGSFISKSSCLLVLAAASSLLLIYSRHFSSHVL